MLEILSNKKYRWLVTGVAGFIGSHLLEALLKYNQEVVGLDNFSMGKEENLEDVKRNVSSQQWERFQLVIGDITDLQICKKVTQKIDFVLHQAALGSVPLSLAHPEKTNAVNVGGHLNMLVAAVESKVQRFIYASSSAVYGDDSLLPKEESKIGRPLSPYALSKYINEMYADLFFKTHQLNCIGLRYFNVFGPRQDPAGPYAAVVPLWILALLNNAPLSINGDGTTGRDFCYVDQVVEINIMAALTLNTQALNQVYNVATQKMTNLNELFQMLEMVMQRDFNLQVDVRPNYQKFRAGDIHLSMANIEKAQKHLLIVPRISLEEGLRKSIHWYLRAIGKGE